MRLITFCCLLLLISPVAGRAQNAAAPLSMDIDADGVPVLVKHLPDWEKVKNQAKLATNKPALIAAAGERVIFSEIEFAGGTEAVTATYAAARVVIIEFPTPQLAFSNDALINQSLANAPNTFYRKTGNYAVFVFDAPDETTANTLLDQVAYEKTVQWLGGNPYPALIAKKKEQSDLVMAGNIIYTVVQAAGISVLVALGIGGICGAFIFYHRRRQHNGVEAFSDAGGMMRLNLDEMTPTNRQLKD